MRILPDFIFEFLISSFEFPVSDFEFPVSTFLQSLNRPITQSLNDITLNSQL